MFSRHYLDDGGTFPKWAQTALKIAAGVAIVAGMVALTVVTFGASAPVTVVATAAVIGAIGGAGVNTFMQYEENGKSFNNFDIDKVIVAGTQGGVSGALAMTGIKLPGQILGNAVIAATGSALNEDEPKDILGNAIVGGLAGLVGGPGTGYGGLHFWQAIRNQELLKQFVKSFLRGVFLTNIFDSLKSIKEALEKSAQSMIPQRGGAR